MIGSTGRSRSPVCDFCGKNRHFSRLGRCGNGRDGRSAGKNKKKSSFRENTIAPLLYMRVAVLCVFCLLFLCKYYIYYIIKSKTDRQDRTETEQEARRYARCLVCLTVLGTHYCTCMHISTCLYLPLIIEQ